MEIQEQLTLIKKGTCEIISEQELITKIKTGKPLSVKFGADPTAPDIHLGHTVVLRKLRQFQEIGHKVIFIIGDFTARIGDPSGRSEIRKVLSEKEVIENAKTYQTQIFKILDKSKTQVVYNSEWLRLMKPEEIMGLASKYTVARMLERDDFKKRYHQGKEISILEFLYPLLQGYDSVVVKADVELGGTDQKFNLLVGRELQRDYRIANQVVITMPLLEGTDGVRKMSKSYNNYVGVLEQAQEMFGKLMAIPDSLMEKYFTLLTDTLWQDVQTLHPKEAKKILAREVVANYYNRNESLLCEQTFERVFHDKEIPDNIPEFRFDKRVIGIVDLLVTAGLVISKSEARRLIAQGGIRIDQQRINDIEAEISLDREKIVQAGKRKFIKIKGY